MIGFTVTASPLIPNGTLIWTKGADVLLIQSREHQEWWAQFGLRAEAPEGATGVTISESDYAALAASIPTTSPNTGANR